MQATSPNVTTSYHCNDHRGNVHWFPIIIVRMGIDIKGMGNNFMINYTFDRVYYYNLIVVSRAIGKHVVLEVAYVHGRVCVSDSFRDLHLMLHDERFSKPLHNEVRGFFEAPLLHRV